MNADRNTGNPVDVSHQMVDIGGLDIHVETRGMGKPLFFLHGIYMSTRMWDWLAPLLEDRYRLIMMDMRGMGLSGDRDEPYAMHADIRKVFDVLGIEKAHVFGLSAGGYAALEFAATNSGRIDRLILSAPGFPPDGNLEKANKDTLEQDRAGRAAAAATAEMLTQAWLDGPAHPGRVADPLRGQVTGIIRHSLSRPPLSRMPDWLQPSIVTRFNAISVPSLVMVGDKDMPACLDIARVLDDGLPQVQKEIVPDAAHFLPIEKPEAVARLVRNFLG